MNIFKRIKEYKKKKGDERFMNTAKKLASMKKERQKLEGREKVYKIRDKEQARIEKSKSNLRKRTPLYRVADAIKKNIKERKAKGSTFGTLPGQNFTLGAMSKNTDIKKPIKKKKKGKEIRIILK